MLRMKSYKFSFFAAASTMACLTIISANISSAEVGLAEAEQRLSDTVEVLEDRVNALEARPEWPAGAYCIVSQNKTCPQGFAYQEAFIRALSVYPKGKTSDYIRESSDKSSGIFIQCHGSCRKYGEWTGEIYVSTCCKSQ